MVKREKVKNVKDLSLKVCKIHINICHNQNQNSVYAQEKPAKDVKVAYKMTETSGDEGVMDNLMEALKDGTAFSRDQKRRKPRPSGGLSDYLHFFYKKNIIQQREDYNWTEVGREEQWFQTIITQILCKKWVLRF